MEDNEWQQEVKKEIQRIKLKNKALENARQKKKQQEETMNKLQCMHLAKNFLANNFKSSMQFLAEKNHWRDSFKDQLNINFKEWLYDSVAGNIQNKVQSHTFSETSANEQLNRIGNTKVPIQKKVQFDLEKKAKFRMIESKDRRIVHFLFDTGRPCKISPFARKLTRFLDGTLEQLTEEENEKMQDYASRYANEELEEDEKSPIVYGDSPFFCVQLNTIRNLCFSIADDPFYKSTISKYYPECIVFNAEGKELARVNSKNKKSEKYNLTYLEDFRDSALRINDDRKIQIGIGGLDKPGIMILLLVREKSTMGLPVKEG